MSGCDEGANHVPTKSYQTPLVCTVLLHTPSFSLLLLKYQSLSRRHVALFRSFRGRQCGSGLASCLENIPDFQRIPSFQRVSPSLERIARLENVRGLDRGERRDGGRSGR